MGSGRLTISRLFAQSHIQILGLDYTRLKKRVHKQAPDTSLPAEAAFIELEPALVPACTCTVEMRHQNGSLTAQGVTGPDLIKPARLFLRLL